MHVIVTPSFYTFWMYNKQLYCTYKVQLQCCCVQLSWVPHSKQRQLMLRHSGIRSLHLQLKHLKGAHPSQSTARLGNLQCIWHHW